VFAIKPDRREIMKFAFGEVKKKIYRLGLTEEAPRGFLQIEPHYFFEMILGRMRNAIGGPSDILVETAALRSFEEPFFLEGRRFRYCADFVLYVNFMARGYGITGTPLIGAASRRHDGQASGKNYPAFSAGIFEWDLLGRWAADAGKLSRSGYASLRERLLKRYYENLDDYPELKDFVQLSNGNPPLLSKEFDAVLNNAYAVIAQRKSEAFQGVVC